mgnify:FL=1
MTTYRHLQSMPNQITFANLARVKNTARFKHDHGRIGSRTQGIDILRTDLLLEDKMRLLPEGVTDQSQALDGAETVRIYTSAPLGSTTIEARLDEAYRLAKLAIANGFFNGFLLQPSSTLSETP